MRSSRRRFGQNARTFLPVWIGLYEADRANLSKSRLLATASHDLRQPLQALSMLHGTLCRMDMHPDSREVLAQQGRAIESMKRLLSALLDISQLESGAVKPQPTDFPLCQLLELLNTEFSTAARSKLSSRMISFTNPDAEISLPNSGSGGPEMEISFPTSLSTRRDFSSVLPSGC